MLANAMPQGARQQYVGTYPTYKKEAQDDAVLVCACPGACFVAMPDSEECRHLTILSQCPCCSVNKPSDLQIIQGRTLGAHAQNHGRHAIARTADIGHLL
jgi:hypothetical protein